MLLQRIMSNCLSSSALSLQINLHKHNNVRNLNLQTKTKEKEKHFLKELKKSKEECSRERNVEIENNYKSNNCVINFFGFKNKYEMY